jgi:hypothetical protein
VLLSILWIVSGWFFHVQVLAPHVGYCAAVSKARAVGYSDTEIADFLNTKSSEPSYERYARCLHPSDTDDLIDSAIVLALVWLFVYAVIWICRWVRAGFRQA